MPYDETDACRFDASCRLRRTLTHITAGLGARLMTVLQLAVVRLLHIAYKNV